MKCLVCNLEMLSSHFHTGKAYCVHRFGKYVVDVWDDDIALCYKSNYTVFIVELKASNKLSEEYIDKMVLLK